MIYERSFLICIQSPRDDDGECNIDLLVESKGRKSLFDLAGFKGSLWIIYRSIELTSANGGLKIFICGKIIISTCQFLN